MIARCKWLDGTKWEYGTILGWQATNECRAIICWDGYNAATRGKIVIKGYQSIQVTTFFNWMGEGHVPGLRGVGTKK